MAEDKGRTGRSRKICYRSEKPALPYPIHSRIRPRRLDRKLRVGERRQELPHQHRICAGIGFGAPSFATILFNGFILGLLVPLSTLTMLLAAILPHGFIEIPSFILAGSIGIKLGYAGLRRFTGAERVADDPVSDVGIGSADSDGYLSRTLRQTVYVVVGLAPLFLIAGLIEADITPIIMRLFGWTF